VHSKCFVTAQMGAPKMERTVAPSEVLAAVLVVLGPWLLLPLLKKFCGAISNGWKLRNLPGPRAGLSGVASVLKVRGTPGAFTRFVALVALGGQAVCCRCSIANAPVQGLPLVCSGRARRGVLALPGPLRV
jgi:hypothetical protein